MPSNTIMVYVKIHCWNYFLDDLFYFITTWGPFVGAPNYGISGQNSPPYQFFMVVPHKLGNSPSFVAAPNYGVQDRMILCRMIFIWREVKLKGCKIWYLYYFMNKRMLIVNNKTKFLVKYNWWWSSVGTSTSVQWQVMVLFHCKDFIRLSEAKATPHAKWSHSNARIADPNITF